MILQRSEPGDRPAVVSDDPFGAALGLACSLTELQLTRPTRSAEAFTRLKG